MGRFATILFALTVSILLVGTALAAQVKVLVAEFTVTGAANKDELKTALRTLLMSRLASAEIVTEDGPGNLQAMVSGSYIAFGQTFSVDATVKNAAGEILGRRFVQGNGQDDLIPAVGRLVEQLRPLLAAVKAEPRVPVAVAPAAPLVPSVSSPIPASDGAKHPGAEMPAAVVAQKVAITGDVIRVEPVGMPVAQQDRIDGAMLGLAPGRPLPNGERELVVAGPKEVRLYRKGAAGLKQLATFTLTGEGTILALDTADVDGDGQLEAYLTVMDREELLSVALTIADQGFSIIAEKLPYYFRTIALEGANPKLYAQQIGKGDQDFFGDLREVLKKGNQYTLGASLPLPKLATIYTVNRFRDAEGVTRLVMLDPDGNLRVLSSAGEELWKGGDRFGGSEVYFQRDEQQLQTITHDRYRWRFLEPRLVVTPAGEIIVARNSGTFVLGNARSFNKNSLFGFAWNGAALTERWHTKESGNYLADYFYDAQRRELVILEQVQKDGLFSKGASSIAIKKVE